MLGKCRPPSARTAVESERWLAKGWSSVPTVGLICFY